jgi:tRNA(Arg) A34 adenosine deaminase TadA
MMEAAAMMAKATIAAGAIIVKEAENLMAEARNPISPRTNLRHHHLVEDAEEAGDHAPDQTPPNIGGTHAARGNV